MANLAVRLWSAESSSAAEVIAGIPLAWPSQVIELGNDTTLPDNTYQLMTTDDFATYRATHQSDYNAYLTSLAPAATAVYVTGKILNAVSFGRQIMAEYGAQNVLAGFNTTQIQTIMATTGNVQSALLSGSLKVALAELATITPDGVLVTQATLDSFRHKIQDYLGVPRT